MYNVSDSYKTFIKKPSRSFECRITLGNRVFNNSDIIQIVPTVVQPVDRFSIGNTVSQSIDITLKNDGATYASVGEIKVEIGLKINNSIEYIPFGTFNIDDVSKTDYTVKLTCYDNMVKFETGYFSKLGNNPTLQEVVNELSTITGVEFTGTLQNYTVTKLEGYTCREVLAYVASVCGGNAYITRDNKFTIIYPHEVDCTITADNYFSTGYKLEDQAYKIGMITCQNKSNSNGDSSESDDYDSVNDKNTISVGDLSSDSMELTFENPWITESILNDIYNKLKNFSYLGYTLKWQGDLSLDPLDIITLVDKNNVTRKALVFANKLTYNGGLSAETSAKGETKNSNSFSASGSSTKNIERLSVKLLIAEKAIINKASIADLQANSARIDKLDTNVATINTALINYATVDQLDAVKANVSDLNASVANIDSALINKANVADLTAAKATISNVSADVANIKTLIGGNLTIANMQSLVLTSSKVTVDNGFIKNAMIESLDVNKINAGTLNTNKISVSSSDGGLVIAGATQQFKDKSSNVRLQMGQDATGEFSFILVGKDGKSTLIDANGIHEGAIADKLIKTNMVADQAIGSQQINYNSFVTGFNASTNTNFIKASKVAIDLTGQTLDIAFNNINTKVDGVKTTTDTNTTSINAIQGQISTLISNTTITNTDGTTTQLKDAYNGTVNTINSMKTSIGELTTDIDANTKNITSVTSRTSTLETNLSSISATLSSTKSTVDAHTTQISTANTNITTALNNASNAVSTANAANTTANSAKTTATTASTNASNAVTTANSASSNASTALTNSNTAISTANTASTNASNAVSTANKASTDVATLTTTVTNTVSRVSSLELTTSGLTTRVGNTETAISSLSIGGRNLIRNSIVDKDISYWSMSFGTRDTNIKFNNHNSVKIRTTGSGYDGIKSNGYTIPFKANTTYTFTIWAYRDSSSSDGNLTKILRVYMPEYKISTLVDYRNYINITSSNLPDKTWTKFTESFTTKSDSTSFSALQIDYNNVAGTSCVWVSDIKIEEGNQATDWTPAPEDIDSSIQSVKDYATQTINSNVSTINQTTDSIKANVSSLQSSVSTINTTLGNKADSSTVTSVTNRVSTLETSVTGINASITTLNSNVSSVTTTANAAKSAIDNLSIGGRNLLQKTGIKNGEYLLSGNVGTSVACTITVIDEATAPYGKAITLARTDTTINSGGRYWTVPKILVSGNIYTWSVWLKGSGSWTVGQEQGGQHLITLTATWTKYTQTFTANSSTYYQFVFYRASGSTGGELNLHSLKLEEGTEATTWTPAPEDVDSQITTVNSSVSSLQSSVSVLQNQIALKVEQNNIDSAITTVNNKITATNSTISSMQSSINLQLNSITSKVQQTISTKNLCVNSAFKYDVINGMNSSNPSCNYGIRDKATYTSWGYSVAPVAGDYVWYQNFYGAGDNYIALPCLYAKVKPNTTYTVSFYYVTGDGGKSSFSSSSSYIFGRTSSDFGKISYSSCLFQLPITFSRDRANWRRCVMTITTKSDTDSIMLRFGWGQGTSDYIDMLVAGVQIEEGSSATDWVEGTNSAVGTTVSQNSNAVMTSFNNISKYFQVSADGATFGDTSTGDYTVLGANGMKHHVGGTDYDYMYITYVMDATINIIEETYTFSGQYATKYDNSDAHKHNYFIPYDSTLKTLLNGRTPKLIMTISSKSLSDPTRPSNWTGTGLSYTYGSLFSFDTTFSFGTDTKQICDANGITMRGINGIYQEIDTYDAYDFIKNKTFNIKTGGTVGVRFLIFA